MKKIFISVVLFIMYSNTLFSQINTCDFYHEVIDSITKHSDLDYKVLNRLIELNSKENLSYFKYYLHDTSLMKMKYKKYKYIKSPKSCFPDSLLFKDSTMSYFNFYGKEEKQIFRIVLSKPLILDNKYILGYAKYYITNTLNNKFIAVYIFEKLENTKAWKLKKITKKSIE